VEHPDMNRTQTASARKHERVHAMGTPNQARCFRVRMGPPCLVWTGLLEQDYPALTGGSHDVADEANLNELAHR
jgi:hypothetical protein